MDKSVDTGIYDEFKDHIDEITESDGTKVLQTRMLKLSLSDDDKEYTYTAIGRELLEAGQFQKSIAPLKKAIIINPLNENAQTNLAKALFKLDKDDEAFSIINLFTAANPKYGTPFDPCQILIVFGKWRCPIYGTHRSWDYLLFHGNIKFSVNLDPCNQKIKKVLGLSLRPESYGLHILLIQKLEEKGKLGDLESISKEIIETIVDQKAVPGFYLASGGALLEHDKFAEALVTYRKGINNEAPMTFENHYDYGNILYYAGLFEEALVQFEHAKNLSPDSKSAVNQIALLNYCLGRVEKAKEEYEYIIQNVLEINVTQSNFYLVLSHIDEDAEVTHQYRDRLRPFITQEGSHMKLHYIEHLKLTQRILERDDIDEQTKEFNQKKLKAINFVLST